MLERLARWRAQCPELVLRSTFIVGFPGGDGVATSSSCSTSCAPPSSTGWAASPTPRWQGAAANDLPNPVPEAVKEERLARFMEVQAEISRAKLAARVGQRLTVLVDEVEEDAVIARSYAEAPEIDGVVIIPGAWELDPGDFIEVEVTDSGDHDLWARPVED